MLQAFVEHKGQKYIPLMFQELEKFIRENGPIIEDIHQRIKIRNVTQFGKLTGDILEKGLRYELKDAQNGLAIYKNTIEKISGYLTVMLDSNYSAQQFLKDQYGISVEYSSLFAKDLKLQWSATYGLLLDRLKIIVGKIAVMHRYLEMQVELYLKLETPNSFIHAIHEEEEIQKIFRMERDAYKRVVNLTKLSTHEVGQIRNVMAAQAHHLKEMLITHLQIIKSGSKDELAASEDRIEKALVVFGFVVRAAVVGTNISSIVVGKTLSHAKERLELMSRSSGSLLTKLTGDQKITQRYVKGLIKILDHIPKFF
tara:strand:+ start:154 stop:1089 length:936 start_codon:yes stop_codon:yes gene_type:complete